MKVLDTFRFAGSVEPKAIDSFYQHLENPKNVMRLKTLSPGEKIIAITQNLKESILRWGRDLGFDLKNRMLPITRIHFVESKSLNQKYSKSKGIFTKTNKPFRGATDLDTFITYICIDLYNGRLRPYPSLAHTICHELVHSIAFKKVDISKIDEKNNYFTTVRSGFKDFNTNAFLLLDECITELTNHYLIAYYWKNFAELQKLYKISQTELSLDTSIVIDALIEELANKSDTKYEEILHLVQKDYIVGSKEFLTIVSRHFGKKAVNLLSNLEPVRLKNIDSIIRIAEGIRLNTLINKLATYKKNQKFDFLTFYLNPEF